MAESTANRRAALNRDKDDELAVAGAAEEAGGEGGGAAAGSSATEQVVRQHKQIEKAIAELMAHPKLKKYGRPHKTSEPEHITDTESEFVVTYLKHAYADRVIFEV